MDNRIKRRIKYILIILFILLIGLGIYKLSTFIIDKSYDSLEIVQEDKKEKPKKVVKEEEPQEIQESEIQGVHGNTVPDEQIINEKQEDSSSSKESNSLSEDYPRVYNLLNKSNSPYKDSLSEYKIVVGDYNENTLIISLLDSSGSTVLDIYVDTIMNSPYLFKRVTAFTEEENSFFSTLGNGSTGNEDDRYYWIYK